MIPFWLFFFEILCFSSKSKTCTIGCLNLKVSVRFAFFIKIFIHTFLTNFLTNKDHLRILWINHKILEYEKEYLHLCCWEHLLNHQFKFRFYPDLGLKIFIHNFLTKKSEQTYSISFPLTFGLITFYMIFWWYYNCAYSILLWVTYTNQVEHMTSYFVLKSSSFVLMFSYFMLIYLLVDACGWYFMHTAWCFVLTFSYFTLIYLLVDACGWYFMHTARCFVLTFSYFMLIYLLVDAHGLCFVLKFSYFMLIIQVIVFKFSYLIFTYF